MKYLFSLIVFIITSVSSVVSVAAPAGQLDPTFGNGGIRTIGFNQLGGNKHDQATAMATAPDGRIYLVGALDVGQFKYKIGITRLTPNGVIDLSFGLGGRVVYENPAIESAHVFDAAFQANGKLVVVGGGDKAGAQNPGLLACRFNFDGTIDPTFGDDQETPGCKLLETSDNAVAYGMALQTDGKIVLAGQTFINGKYRALLVRLTANGALDGSFGQGGVKVPFPSWISGNSFADVAIAPDGKLVAVGMSKPEGESDFLVARFLPENGSLDQTFDGGWQTVAFNAGGDNTDIAYSVQVLANGSVLIGGHVETAIGSQYRAAIAKLSSTGQPDASIGPNGRRIINACGNCYMQSYDMQVLSNGRIVMAGVIGNPVNPTTFDMFAVRLLANGDMDASFNGGISIIDIGGNADVAVRLAPQGARLLLAGSSLQGVNGDDYAIIRLDHGLNSSFTVTPSAGAGGSISPNVPQLVAHSNYVQFTLTPNPGFVIQSVNSNCGGGLVGNVYTAGPITQNCQVNAVFAANVTLTYVAGENGSLQGQTNQVVPYNGSGTPVTAVPDVGYTFKQWSDGSIQNPRQDIKVTNNINVTAYFEVLAFKVVPEAGSGGALDPAEAYLVEYGQKTLLTVLPNPGFGVVGVSSNGCDGLLVGNTYVVGPVVGPGNCVVSATFAPSNVVYALNYTAGLNCSLAGDLDQAVISGNDGTPVTVTPDPGYVFVQWSDGSTDPVRQDTHVFNHINVTAQCAAQDATIYTVTPVSGLGGALSPPVAQLIAEGNSAEFKVLPAPGYAIEGVSSTCGGGSLVGNTYTTTPVFGDCEVQATFVVSNTMYSLTYAAGAGGAVQGTLNQQVISGGSGTPVTAVANPGRYFVQWSDGSTDNPRQDKNVIANVNVTAQFAMNGTLMVESVAGPNGTISPEGIQVVDPGIILQFTVTPNEGFAIADVQGCGGNLVDKIFTTAPVETSCKVQAAFVPTNEVYLLKYAAGPNGTLQGEVEQVVPSGGTGKSVTAMPDPGYIFLQWSDGSNQNPRTDEGVIANVDVTAQFILPGSLLVTPSAGIGGSISPNTVQVVTEGDVVQFSVLPDPGFAINAVGGTCGGSLNGKTYTTDPIVASCTVDASFVPSNQMYSLTYAAGPNGTLQGQLNQQVISGGSGTAVTAVPNPGFFFVQWSDGLQQNPRTDVNVIADVNVTAQFAINGNFVVTPIAGPGGSLSPNLAQVVAPNGVVQFTVQPDPGFVIETVNGCGGGLVGNVFTTAPVQANCQVQAAFKSSNEIFQLTYLAGPNGSIQGDADQLVPAGGDGELVTAVPNPGFFFVKWSDGQVQAARQDMNVSGDIAVTAEFAENGTPVYMVTPTAGPGGTLSPNVPQIVIEGDNALFTILPNPGFAIQDVIGCDGTLVNNIYVTAPVFADCEVHATFVPSGEAFTLTYTAGANGLVNGQAFVEVVVPAGGQGVEVEAQPAPGFFFVQWSDGWLENPRQDTNVAGDIDVTAQFAANGTPVHVVMPLSGLGGALSPPLPQNIVDGGVAQFQVLPNPGFIIANVGGTCGGSLVGNIYTTNPVFGDCTVEADFVASDEIFTLVYIAGPNGQVNGQAMIVQNVQAGGTAEPVQAQPAPGFMFVQWSDGWQESQRQDMNVVGDMEVTAQFAPNGVPTFTVTPMPGPGGALSPPVPQQIAQGNVAQFTVLPDDGFGVESVGGTCGGNLVGDVFTTAPIIANCTVEVTFFNDRIFYNGFGFGEEQE